MSQLQEVSWVEKVALDAQISLAKKQSTLLGRLNLYRLPWLRPIIESRWPQFILRLLTLSGFIFTIAAGLLGSKVGSHNFAIIFVWIAWWTTLKLVFIPLGGRSWCSICPIPLPGEWLQQGGILEPGPRKLGLNLRWPKWLKGSWMQSGGFLLIGLFSALTLTDPKITAWVLLGIFVLAIGLSLVFEKRPFCTTFCPIGGFSGMYAQTAPVEVRAIDKEICSRHEVKTCYQACPWGLYPVGFRNNTACGMCMECLRACPHDNLALNLRQPATDLGNAKTSPKLDESLLALVMMGSVLAFSAVFTGPWGWLKSAAFDVGSLRWIGYAASYLGLNLLLLPGLFAFAVWVGEKFPRKAMAFKRAVATQAQVLIPLGLMAWIAFTVSFAFPKLDFVTGVINDPFGWGWKLLGPFANSAITNVSSINMLIQVVVLLIGFTWSMNISRKIASAGAKSSRRVNFPVQAFSLAFTLAMLWLLVG